MDYGSPLFSALLALDSYNRGYHQGVAGLSREPGTQLGYATLVRDTISAEAQAASFYATAWRINGQQYIAYRGTDVRDVLASSDDIWGGWSIGLGFSAGTQADLAAKFYEAVRLNHTPALPHSALVRRGRT